MTHLTEQQAKQDAALIERVLYELKKVIVGQEQLLERLLVAVIAHGHVLVEGAPGLAKTLTLKSLAQVLSVDFKRIQFTPDLLPSDVIGTRVFNPGTTHFSTETGPVFAHFILADEINRAPAKVQSALLEAMEERQVTIGRETFPLPSPFMVMATQNPIESEGTYQLPEAQLDRFLMKLMVNYPTSREENTILQRMTMGQPLQLQPVLSADQIQSLSDHAEQVYVDPKLLDYIVDLVVSTREKLGPNVSANPNDLSNTTDLAWSNAIQFGASPRGSLALTRAAKALALIHGRHYLIPADVMVLAKDCLRHRILLSYEGIAAGKTVDGILDHILNVVPVPKLTSHGSSEPVAPPDGGQG